jgi:hypothetical protein
MKISLDASKNGFDSRKNKKIYSENFQNILIDMYMCFKNFLQQLIRNQHEYIA